MSGRGRGGRRGGRGVPGKRKGGERRADRGHDLELKERAGEGLPSPTKPVEGAGGGRHEKQEQRRQQDQEFAALWGGKADPAVTKSVVGRQDSVTDNNNKTARASIPRLRTAIKLVDENHVFCDSLSDYLLADNTDFLVVGVFGLQNVGKSTVINALAKLCPKEEDLFRVQAFDHQMSAEYCTNGIDVYVNSRRIILLDCQPLLLTSVTDSTIQLEKRLTCEFNSSENTMEVHSLQQVGFLFSVCHTVILVQDWINDTNLTRLTMAAEMLKPVTPTLLAEDKIMPEYFPHLVIVHNKTFIDTEPVKVSELRDFYSRELRKSRLQCKAGLDDARPLLVFLPDYAGERSDNSQHRITPDQKFEQAVKHLRETVFSQKRSPLTQTELSERGWVSLANRTWDNIKKSPKKRGSRWDKSSYQNLSMSFHGWCVSRGVPLDGNEHGERAHTLTESD